MAAFLITDFEMHRKRDFKMQIDGPTIRVLPGIKHRLTTWNVGG
jgi:hypothetical protein